MNPLLAALLGVGTGLGLLLVVFGFFPPRVRLVDALAALHPAPEPPPPLTTPSEAGWASRFGRRLAPAVAACGLPLPAVRRDLRVLGRDVAVHRAEQATSAVFGLLVPPLLLAALAWLAGADPGVVWPVGAGVLCAAGFAFVPDLNVRNEARARREEMRHTLSAFCDLAVVALSGGAGVEQALGDAAATLDGTAAQNLRRALATAELTRVPPWGPLRRLGEETDVAELRELAATVALAGNEGAKVRTSLAAKASALRTRQLADAQGAAGQATERMSLPLVVLFAGFLIFLGYPALAHVLDAL
ncbi:type II secretion system F family protein [Yinghuangia sp. ASG 101]|uniref:type II secretion system F family protein n=1 Tax=Yinghuangia sp. ASG 101 TaxID=2896848 RepID=UPI001E457B21|nr:type II secretion system F family protein [Yinghuangia sp. ASG 101]UGQ13588.1 type II secretion system F family protein [Yinghuangia sp. ASG 101]